MAGSGRGGEKKKRGGKKKKGKGSYTGRSHAAPRCKGSRRSRAVAGFWPRRQGKKGSEGKKKKKEKKGKKKGGGETGRGA